MKLFDHQIAAVDFLERNPHAILGDEQRVGKTAAAIVAAYDNFIKSILLVSPVSVTENWRWEFGNWGHHGRVGIEDPTADICIVPWSKVATGKLAEAIRRKAWQMLLLDESHYAKNFSAQRTRAVFGTPDGRALNTTTALTRNVQRVWCLTGTPLPHDPTDLYPTLRGIMPEVLLAHDGFPDVLNYADFEARYAVTGMKQISRWNRIKVILGGRNEHELRARIGDRFLRRRQRDVGINPPIVSPMMVHISESERREIARVTDLNRVLQMIDTGTGDDTHLAKLRHLTGDIKARATPAAVIDFFASSPPDEKLVLAYWHKSVGDTIEAALAAKGIRVARLDGSIQRKDRAPVIAQFQQGPARVFLGQIEASCEGIDLSAAAELWFVESVFTPRLMSQMAMRIANLNQTRQCLVRVSTLAGSVDENIQATLIRLMGSINAVLGDTE